LKFFLFTKLKASFISSFQVAHDHCQLQSGKMILEYVWGKCKMCGQQVGEVRVFDEHSCKLTKVISVYDWIPQTETYGLGCRLFEDHMKHR
jgi:hypothetical protein